MVHYSTDSKKLPRFHTSIGNDQEKLLYWRDGLSLAATPSSYSGTSGLKSQPDSGNFVVAACDARRTPELVSWQIDGC
jgi:hypothetical protein